MKRENEWLSKLRGLTRFLPGRGATLRADAILAGSRQTIRDIPVQHHGRVVYLPENAIDPARFWRRADHGAALAGGVLRACFIGRLVPLKGVDMLIAAAAPLLASGRMVLEIIGDGEMSDSLKAQAQPFGDAVIFHGWKKHEEVQDIAAGCTVLTFPSIREFGGGVVLEAMALGLCPVVIDYAGPAELVTAQTGYAVPIGDRAQVIAGLAAQLAHCAENPQEVAQKAAAARARVEALFTWDCKAAQIRSVYDWVLQPDLPKPMPFGQG